MTPVLALATADAVLGILLVALCTHVGILSLSIVRALLPGRRHPDHVAALAAGGCALAGELLALGALLGRTPPLAWVAGLLGLGVVLGVIARAAWREHPVGRAAFHAVVAAPLVAVFVVALAFR